MAVVPMLFESGFANRSQRTYLCMGEISTRCVSNMRLGIIITVSLESELTEHVQAGVRRKLNIFGLSLRL